MSMSISTAIPPTCCPRWRAGNPRISLPPEKSGRSAPTRSKLSRSPESRQPCLALRCMAGKPFVHRGRRNPDRPSNHARLFPRLSSRDNQGSHLWRGFGILVDVHGLSPDDRAASQPPPSPVSAREQPIETLHLGCGFLMWPGGMISCPIIFRTGAAMPVRGGWHCLRILWACCPVHRRSRRSQRLFPWRSPRIPIRCTQRRLRLPPELS